MSLTDPRSSAATVGAFDLNIYIATKACRVNRALDEFLPGPKIRPATIHQAMRYSIFAGGKRMRPALCLAAAEACGGSETGALSKGTKPTQSWAFLFFVARLPSATILPDNERVAEFVRRTLTLTDQGNRQ